MSHESNLPHTQAIYEASKAAESVVNTDIIELSTQQIAITDGATVSLTVPEHAVGAMIQFVGDTDDSKIKFTVDGVTTPSDSAGNEIFHSQTFHLGKTAWVPRGDIDNLANFEAIAKTGFAGYLRVHYFQRK